MRVKDKVALISGAASGMGAETARLFAREGAKAVVIGDLLEAEGRKVADEINAAGGTASFLRLDVTDEASWQDVVGKTPGQYLQTWRLGLAQQLVRQGVSMRHVADEVGYADEAALSRAFKSGEFTLPDDLAARTEAALRQAALDRLGLEARAGTLLTGAEKIETAARKGDVRLLIHASDAGVDGNSKLDQAWRVGREAEGTGLAGSILPLDRAALSVALGRDNVVHLALTDSAAARRLAALLSRLMRFLGRVDGPGVRPAAEATHDTAAARPDATI